ncbi:MAG: hypothetical protein IMZ41_02505, partial [Actinobacteria bacterium]|nr:hypothetical protein [Actinomycetota bacterium]
MKTFFKKIGSLIVTKEIFEDKKSLRTLYKYFLIGLLVRFIFLPFFFHRDLLSTYQRAAETISTGNFGLDNLQMLTNVIHSIYLFIIKLIFPAINQLSSVLLEKDSWIAWISFNSSYNVFTVLTLFKILYLIFDIACMFIILRFSFDGEPEDKLRVFKFWIFNPIVIFVLYIFARHDIIGVFVTLVALLLAKKDRKYWAIIVLAFGIALRFFPIMILPLFIFYLARTKKDYIILSLVGVSGLVAVELFCHFYFGKSVIIPLLNTQHFDFILSTKLDLVIGSHDSIFIFVAVYIIIILSFLHIKKKSFDILLNYGAIIYLAYVSLCYFHPQYMLWIVPFLVIIFARRRHLLYYHWIQFALLLVILIYWGD